MHTFNAHLFWSNEPQSLNVSTRRTLKNHTISIQGKESMALSAAKAFKGDPSLWNPEDMLLSSLMSCHMMSYLYVCNQNGVEVLLYEDHAEATLEVSPDGSGRITKVILKPKVSIFDNTQLQQALELHAIAHKLCFIANSCKFEIVVVPIGY